MRKKIRTRRRAEAKVEGECSPIDMGDTARQLGLFETANGWQHGFIGILVALIAALLWLPLRSFLRSGFRDRR